MKQYIASKLRRKGKCLEWQGYKHKSGYGHIRVEDKIKKVHRVVYELWVGPIDDGNVIMHLCDNKICCNPNHLKQGTQKDNIKDMINKGRARWQKLDK